MKLVIITGDITDTAEPEQYNLAFLFFKSLADEFGLNHEYFIFVPGNHDVSWANCKKIEEDGKKLGLNDYEIRDQLDQAKLLPFEDFLQKFYGRSRRDFLDNLGKNAYIYNFMESNLTIAALNSCEKESHRLEDRIGKFGDKQAKSLMLYWRNKKSNFQLKIVAIHHNPVPMVDRSIQDAINYLKKLYKEQKLSNDSFQRFSADIVGFEGRDFLKAITEDCQVQLVLHGHYHATNRNAWPWKKEGQTNVLSAGSFGLVSDELPRDSYNTQNLIFIDISERKIHSWELVYNPLIRPEGSIFNGDFTLGDVILDAHNLLIPDDSIQSNLSQEQIAKGSTSELTNREVSVLSICIPSCQYRGLYSFEEKDSPIFFGRYTLTKRLVDLLREKSMVAVIGSSGSGKSSLIFAGLVPQLRAENNWIIISFRPTNHPLYALAAALISYIGEYSSDVERIFKINDMVREFYEESICEERISLEGVLEIIIQRTLADQKLLLIIDQFEEIYTLCNDLMERNVFLKLLTRAINSKLFKFQEKNKILLALRADFFNHALSTRNFADMLQDSTFILSPMSKEELRDVIEKPALQKNITFEDGLTDRIIEAIGEDSNCLPILEFTLTLLWERQQNGKIKHVAYKEIGGIENALTSYADDRYNRLTDFDKILAEMIFIQLVQPGVDTEDTRRQAIREEIGENCWDLVRRLADDRLVVTGRSNKSLDETVEVVHEALIQRWGRLREWMELNREFRIWQERLRSSIEQWEISDLDYRALLGGVLLAEANEWYDKRSDSLTLKERDFILQSLHHQESEEKRWKNLYESALTHKMALHIELQGMQSIISNAENIKNDLIGAKSNIELINIADEIINEALKLSHSLGNVTKSPIDGSKDKLRFNTINIYPLLSDSINLFRDEAFIKGIIIRGPISKGTSFPPLEISESHIRHALVNLIDNAVKYSFKGHFPREQYIDIICENIDKYLCIEITNYGIGIRSNEIETQLIFQDGYRGELAMDRVRTGSGLGLGVVREIINAHNGKISVSSELLSGHKDDYFKNVFKIYLPFMQILNE